jgi:hypothetical protein
MAKYVSGDFGTSWSFQNPIGKNSPKLVTLILSPNTNHKIRALYIYDFRYPDYVG